MKFTQYAGSRTGVTLPASDRRPDNPPADCLCHRLSTGHFLHLLIASTRKPTVLQQDAFPLYHASLASESLKIPPCSNRRKLRKKRRRSVGTAGKCGKAVVLFGDSTLSEDVLLRCSICHRSSRVWYLAKCHRHSFHSWSRMLAWEDQICPFSRGQC